MHLKSSGPFCAPLHARRPRKLGYAPDCRRRLRRAPRFRPLVPCAPPIIRRAPEAVIFGECRHTTFYREKGVLPNRTRGVPDFAETITIEPQPWLYKKLVMLGSYRNGSLFLRVRPPQCILDLSTGG